MIFAPFSHKIIGRKKERKRKEKGEKEKGKEVGETRRGRDEEKDMEKKKEEVNEGREEEKKKTIQIKTTHEKCQEMREVEKRCEKIRKEAEEMEERMREAKLREEEEEKPCKILIMENWDKGTLEVEVQQYLLKRGIQVDNIQMIEGIDSSRARKEKRRSEREDPMGKWDGIITEYIQY